MRIGPRMGRLGGLLFWTCMATQAAVQPMAFAAAPAPQAIGSRGPDPVARLPNAVAEARTPVGVAVKPEDCTTEKLQALAPRDGARA